MVDRLASMSDAQMKTLQLGLDWFPERAGGLPRYYYDLLQAAPSHFEARGLVLGSDNVARETQGRVQAFAAASDSLPKRMLGIRRAFGQVVREQDPDLIVSHFALFTLPVLDRIDRPLVVHFHGPWAGEGAVEGASSLGYLVKKGVEQAVYRRGRLFIVLSQAFGDLLHRQYGVPERNIRVIPGGVDFARFDIAESRGEARARLGWPTDRPIMLAVRRLVRRMGLDVLIEAMRTVVQRHPDALLLIAGRGPLQNELAARIEALGLGRNVELIGFLPDEHLPLAYRAADLSVVPTLALEGFGLIALESLAAGTPAVVTPVGGLPEIVRPLSDHLVFESSQAGAIAERLIALLGSPLAPSASSCRAFAQANAWPNIVGRIADAYREALL